MRNKLKSLFILGVLSFSYTFAQEIVCAEKLDPKEVNNSVKWYRDSAEMRALYNQGYNIATQYINNQTKDLKPKSWGVILDIDETVLDNSWYSKSCKGALQEDVFSKYVALPKLSVALPQAIKFTCNIQKQGGYVSLVSNRDGSFPGVFAATIDNLKKEGVCFDQLILANRKQNKNPSDKNPRFNAVISGICQTNSLMICSNALPKHYVIAYLGDNIQDFPNLKQKEVIKLDKNDKSFDKFGNGYFIFPNPYYGSWQQNKFN